MKTFEQYFPKGTVQMMFETLNWALLGLKLLNEKPVQESLLALKITFQRISSRLCEYVA